MQSTYEGKKSSSHDPEVPTVKLGGRRTDLKRALKARHVTMISIGGVIGTGLFLGTASALANGGPLGLLLGYVIVGSLCYSVMICLGEMIALLPVAGGHIKLAERFVDPAFSFAMGWIYWYSLIFALPAELSAASVLVNFWIASSTVNDAVWITIFILIVLCINIFGVGVYGEFEFVFASTKVITIVGLIILGIVLDLGGGPSHDRLGFRYWSNPGPFTQYLGIPGAKGRFLAFWAVMIQAAFSYVGTEIVAVAAGETRNPRRNISKAMRHVYIRILLFYICGTFVIGLLVPSNDPKLGLGNIEGSPFVIAIQNAGIRTLPSIINAAVLTSACSAASSQLYTSSRATYGLALSGNAPRFLLFTTKNGLPFISLAVCSLFCFLAYMGLSEGSGKVFGWFVNLTSNCGLVTWFAVAVSYIRFHKGYAAQGLSRKELPFSNPLSPYAAWYVAVSSLVISFFSGYFVFLDGHWDTASFVTNYLPLMMFPILYVCARLHLHVTPVRASEMDFVTGMKEVEDASHVEKQSRNWIEHVWIWLM